MDTELRQLEEELNRHLQDFHAFAASGGGTDLTAVIGFLTVLNVQTTETLVKTLALLRRDRDHANRLLGGL